MSYRLAEKSDFRTVPQKVNLDNMHIINRSRGKVGLFRICFFGNMHYMGLFEESQSAMIYTSEAGLTI